MKRALKYVALILLAASIGYHVWLAVPRHDYFVERVGAITVADERSYTDAKGVHSELHLESSTGLAVDLRVLRPNDSAYNKLPVLLVAGGYRTGKDAVDRAGAPKGIIFAAIDYPYAGTPSVRGLRQWFGTLPAIQTAFLDTPPALSLAATWLAAQPWVDANRIELVGVSLGVPFAAAAGATNPDFSRVWLLHGGGDNVSWVAHAGRKDIDNDTLRYLAARLALLFVHGSSFDTLKWIRLIAPRPVIILAARDDDYVPPEAQAPFVELASEVHVELIWTEGRHVRPNRDNELRQLLDIVLARAVGDLELQ